MDLTSLHELLRSTCGEMMPLCPEMTGIAKGVAGLGASSHITLRVWAPTAHTEAIDAFSSLCPFALGFCITFFPTFVLETMDAALSSVMQGMEEMVNR